MNENTKFLSYLPLAHIFDRASEEIVLYAGGEIGYWRGNVLGLIDDANAFKPTYMAGRVQPSFELLDSATCAERMLAR